ncbi:hypothetical protein P3T76_004431 [Phytophthora citrophthora]|uniref:Uncharacterized protein n=1 Tax=Phytophthora citrophthora TaxID=4793 RepID=A0AAD9GSX7_9STRA|nr:hypothetical protein P3T76_004431 [Phytophthora citrophthora]
MITKSNMGETRHVCLSPCGFTFWWLIILVIHLVACGYNGVYAKLYWGFDLTMFSFLLEFNRIGITREYYSTVAYVYIMLAAVHGGCALLMLVGSICQRKLVFMPKRGKKFGYFGRNIGNADADAIETHTVNSYRVIHVLSVVYHRLGKHFEVFGVNGKYFHVFLLCREVIEVALQTAQAIRMSKYVPRLLLNRFYVSLLVLNCWSAIFVYSRWFWHDEARRRFAAIVCDCVLNLMSTIGVTLIITLSYVSMYDIDNFDWHVLDDDVWFSQMLNEARVVLVMSWLDLISRIIFSLGVVSTAADMKELLRYKSTRKNQVTITGGPNLTNIGPKAEDIGTTAPKTQIVGRLSRYTSTGFHTRWSLVMLQFSHYAFAAWGVVILSLHIHAAMQTPLFECTPKVYPMAGALPSCYTVRLDCYSMGISGLKQEICNEWDQFDHTTTVKLIIQHCTSLEVPDSFQDFSGLQSIVVYNSTIVDWGDTAAITNTHHPVVRYLTIARVNMTEGSLPLGFQATDFPSTLFEMDFCVTNLKSLPDDLDSKWAAGSVVFLENSELAYVPLSLIRLQPIYLSLNGNPITELPPELFEGKIEYVFVGNTQVNELPLNVIPTTLSTLDVTNTNISFFPAWIDPLVDVSGEMYSLLVAGGSTYCSDLESIRKGKSNDFRVPFQLEQSIVLMNASEANWGVLSQVINCSPPLSTTQFSLDYFDVLYGLN